MTHVTLLDGGMGQELVRRSAADPTPMWSARVMLDHPELVVTLHEEFIQAGAEVITVNAYAATPERLACYELEPQFEALQQSACEAAKQARKNTRQDAVKIAGTLPPLVASYRPDIAPDKEQSLINYRRIVAQQAEHVDLFICETMGSVSEALNASTAALESGKPVWVALTLDDNNPQCLRSGEHWRLAVDAMADLDIEALLINCSRPETINHSWGEFSKQTAHKVGAYANGFTAIDALQPGGTVASLETRQDLGPDSYARYAAQWIADGASIVGGCCEVSPEHIAYIHQCTLGRQAA